MATWKSGKCDACGRTMPLLKDKCGACRTKALGTPHVKPPLPAGVAVWIGGESFMESSPNPHPLDIPEGDATVQIICMDSRVWHDCGRLGRWLYVKEGITVMIQPAWVTEEVDA